MPFAVTCRMRLIACVSAADGWINAACESYANAAGLAPATPACLGASVGLIWSLDPARRRPQISKGSAVVGPCATACTWVIVMEGCPTFRAVCL